MTVPQMKRGNIYLVSRQICFESGNFSGVDPDFVAVGEKRKKKGIWRKKRE